MYVCGLAMRYYITDMRHKREMMIDMILHYCTKLSMLVKEGTKI